MPPIIIELKTLSGVSAPIHAYAATLTDRLMHARIAWLRISQNVTIDTMCVRRLANWRHMAFSEASDQNMVSNSRAHARPT